MPEALAFLQGMEEGERAARARGAGPDSREPGDDVEEGAALDAEVRQSMEAALLRAEAAATDAEMIVYRLRLALASAELGVRAAGLRPGYGPPREARSRRDREETIEYQDGTPEDVDYDDLSPSALPPDDEPDPASDIAAATRGI